MTAQELFNLHYQEIITCTEADKSDFQEEIIISILAIRHAIVTAKLLGLPQSIIEELKQM